MVHKGWASGLLQTSAVKRQTQNLVSVALTVRDRSLKVDNDPGSTPPPPQVPHITYDINVFSFLKLKKSDPSLLRTIW